MRLKMKKKLTLEQILIRLAVPGKKLIRSTVLRYQHGPYSNIFNLEEVQALAEDTALEVCRRVMLFQKNKKHQEGVDPKGCEAYFSRAFINQCQKMYEKYAKTDTRAGVQTVGTEEAMAVAVNKNFISPENSYILNDEFSFLIKELEKQDKKYNDKKIEFLSREGRGVKNEDLQYSAFIIKQSLLGFEAHEIKEDIGLSDTEYSRHRKNALELARQIIPSSLEDLLHHVENTQDSRLLSREVKKRKKAIHLMDLKYSKNFIVESKKTPSGWKTCLICKIDVLDGDDLVKKIPSQVMKIKEITSEENNKEIRESLWDLSKKTEIIKMIDEFSSNYLEKVRQVS